MLLALASVGCGSAPSPVRIRGGGATFVEPLIQRWQSAYLQTHGIEVDYTGAGSGNGIQQMIRGTLLFGCTDVPLNAGQLDLARSIGGEVDYIPLAIGGVVPIFHLPGFDSSTIRFTGQVLAGIFLGKITRWNDPSLQSLNSNIELPDLEIRIVSRSEPSGTTALFAEYLAHSDSNMWRLKNMGQGAHVTFPVGVRQKGNPGVAGEVARTAGAIGYVELTYARQIQAHVGCGAIRNRAGHFVSASSETISAAAAELSTIPDDLVFSLIDSPGTASYPICGADWAVFYRRQTSLVGRRLADFLQWAISPEGGQSFTAPLGYGRLPQRLIEKAGAKLNAIEIN